MLAILRAHAERLGPLQASDGPQHPRRVLANNVGYFQTPRRHMDYPAYRRKGWPIGWIYRRESRTLLDYERTIANMFDASVFVTEEEAALFKRLAQGCTGFVGVDAQ